MRDRNVSPTFWKRPKPGGQIAKVRSVRIQISISIILTVFFPGILTRNWYFIRHLLMRHLLMYMVYWFHFRKKVSLHLLYIKKKFLRNGYFFSFFTRHLIMHRV